MTTQELDTLKDLFNKFTKEAIIDDKTKQEIYNAIHILRHLNGDEAVINKQQKDQINCKKLVI